MKKVLILFCIVLFVSCSSSKYYNWDFSLVKPTKSRELTFSDKIMDITFAIGSKEIGFQIRNKTNKGIKINWDELAFISPMGESKRVIHKGVKFIKSEEMQAATVVPPKSKFTDIIVPAENISYFMSAWQIKDLFPATKKSDYLHKEFSLYFPLEIKKETIEYMFTFKIEEVIIKKTESGIEEW